LRDAGPDGFGDARFLFGFVVHGLVSDNIRYVN
jgi:hypothetical protein